ncbi:probable protein phosphatase 2C 80 [Populus nigra]|uniref:probable protein phosphatase 2C 80 n=1 Tax=Populus nigra TaxID=3691 RepID=UPI002B2754E4|nr:probable protein phosphatase 2C 80 [Populus nigra]
MASQTAKLIPEKFWMLLIQRPKLKDPPQSTACILTLDQDEGLTTVNMGDSGFLVIRKDGDVYKSPIQQYSFNYPYQLQDNDRSRTPSGAQVTTLPVEAGDVIVAGTDGLFDNLYPRQIEELVRTKIEGGSDPQDVAWAVAGQAYCTSMDREAFTPFTEGSLEAGKSSAGGKEDDITVIVSCIVDDSL